MEKRDEKGEMMTKNNHSDSQIQPEYRISHAHHIISGNCSYCHSV